MQQPSLQAERLLWLSPNSSLPFVFAVLALEVDTARQRIKQLTHEQDPGRLQGCHGAYIELGVATMYRLTIEVMKFSRLRLREFTF